MVLLALRLVLALAGLALMATSAPVASAGLIDGTLAGCSGLTYERPFLPWLDPAQYVLAPDGGLEAGASGWTLAGGARVVAGNETFSVGGATDARSLALPAASSATTAPMCVDLDAPTLRFFARNGGSLLSGLKVDAVFSTALGPQTVRVATVLGGRAWQPTLPLPILANAFAPLSGGQLKVRFRFTPAGDAGAWQIDDVYLDPYLGR